MRNAKLALLIAGVALGTGCQKSAAPAPAKSPVAPAQAVPAAPAVASPSQVKVGAVAAILDASDDWPPGSGVESYRTANFSAAAPRAAVDQFAPRIEQPPAPASRRQVVARDEDDQAAPSSRGTQPQKSNASAVQAVQRQVDSTRRELLLAEQRLSELQRENNLGKRITQKSERTQTENEVNGLRSRLRQLEDELRRAEAGR